LAGVAIYAAWRRAALTADVTIEKRAQASKRLASEHSRQTFSAAS
jgi:hypothetical protein